jgi:hypothetical protein
MVHVCSYILFTCRNTWVLNGKKFIFGERFSTLENQAKVLGFQTVKSLLILSQRPAACE